MKVDTDAEITQIVPAGEVAARMSDLLYRDPHRITTHKAILQVSEQRQNLLVVAM